MSRGRLITARTLQLLLPASGLTLLYCIVMYPDEDALLPPKLPPELQYLASQTAECTEVLTNWSATHEARPK